MTEVRTFCRICTALCGTVVTVEADGVVSHVGGDRDHPISRGYTCAKGRALPAQHHHPQRLEHPTIRTPDGSVRRVSWLELLDDLATRTRSVVNRHGPDGVAAYLATGAAFDTAGRRAVESFLRALGTAQKYTAMTVDTPAKPLVAELVGGWSGLMPIWDEERCNLLLVVGLNPVISHGHGTGMPNPRNRMRDQARRGQLWVVDPRATETARLATRHLQPRPGTDHLLIGHLVRELLREGADADFVAAHAEGAERLAEAVDWMDRVTVTAASGVPEQALGDLVAAVRAAGRISVLTGTGVTMTAAANVTEWLVWALQVVTGSLDRPGGMWFNPGYLQRVDTRRVTPAPPEGRTAPGPRSRPDLLARFGERPCSALVPEIEAGNVTALFVFGGNLLTAFPDSARTRAALGRLEVLAVADIVENETTDVATHVLPSVGQLERSDVPFLTDTYQSAVMSQRTPAVVPPVAERKPVWWSFAQLGRRLGLDVLPDGLDPDTATDDDVLAPVLARSVDGAALWASPTAVVASAAVFGWVTEQVLPDGRWRLAPSPLVEQLAELRGRPASPLVLTPRRQLGTMNSQLRDVAPPGDAVPSPDVLVSPVDAAAANVEDGGSVRVVSSHGSTVGRARVSAEIASGAVSIPHGWGAPDVCALTSGDEDIDPLTGMVLQSGVAVRIEPVA